MGLCCLLGLCGGNKPKMTEEERWQLLDDVPTETFYDRSNDDKVLEFDIKSSKLLGFRCWKNWSIDDDTSCSGLSFRGVYQSEAGNHFIYWYEYESKSTWGRGRPPRRGAHVISKNAAFREWERLDVKVVGRDWWTFDVDLERV